MDGDSARRRPAPALRPYAGAEVLRDLNDTDDGSRDCILRDPEGNRWSFGTCRGHPGTG